LSIEAFQSYWRTRHAPLVAERAKSLGILRYVQAHSLHDADFNYLADDRGCRVPPYDGVAELWFGSPNVLARTQQTPEAALAASRTLMEDEAQFIDLANSAIFVVEEHQIFIGDKAM
jgi:hypothetical protein